MKIRITPLMKNEREASVTDARAEIRSLGRKGTISLAYVPQSAVDRMLADGFAYTNQPKERVV